MRRSLSVSDTCPNLIIASSRVRVWERMLCQNSDNLIERVDTSFAFAEFCKSILSIYRARAGERSILFTEFCETSVQESTSRGYRHYCPCPSGTGEEREARVGVGARQISDKQRVDTRCSSRVWVW